MKKHSFIISAYKSSQFLEICVKHLLAQKFESDVIIATSTPNEAIEKIAAKYSLKYCINPVSNAGIAADWNFALKCATTQFVTIAHQDDIYLPEYSKAVLDVIAGVEESKVLIAFSDYIDLIDNKERPNSLNAFVKRLMLSPFLISRSIQSKALKRAILLFGNPICCPAVTFNKTLLRDFQFSDRYHFALDWQAWIELAKREGAFVYLNRRLMKHRIHRASETTLQINSGRRRQEERRVFEILWGKRVASVISRIYAIAQKQNQV